MIARVTCVVSAAVALAACVIGPQTSGDAGASDAAGTTTVGDQCTDILTELCRQASSRCAMQGFTIDQCVANDMSTCCTGSACNATSQSSAADVSACKQAIDAEDCNLIANSATPAACQGVPRKP
jgi:hypothetical protein